VKNCAFVSILMLGKTCKDEVKMFNINIKTSNVKHIVRIKISSRYDHAPLSI